MTELELLGQPEPHISLLGMVLCAMCLLSTWKASFDLMFAEEFEAGIWYSVVGSVLAASVLVML